MYNEKAIAEYCKMLVSTFENYKKKPTWDKLQTMFQQTLLLGIELGLKRAYMNQQMKNSFEKDYRRYKYDPNYKKIN